MRLHDRGEVRADDRRLVVVRRDCEQRRLVGDNEAALADQIRRGRKTDSRRRHYFLFGGAGANKLIFVIFIKTCNGGVTVELL